MTKMSPTLLEVTVGILLLWLAWQIGLLIAPPVLRYFKTTLRGDDLRPGAASRRPEKNVTPRSHPEMQPPPNGNPPV